MFMSPSQKHLGQWAWFLLGFCLATWLVRSWFSIQESNWGLQQWKRRVLTTGPSGKSRLWGFFKIYLAVLSQLQHSGCFVSVHRLSSCTVRAPEQWASIVTSQGLTCSAAGGVLVPWLGIEPVSPALQGGFLTTGPPGKSLWGLEQVSEVPSTFHFYTWKWEEQSF